MRIDEELKQLFLDYIEKERSLTDICLEFNMNAYEVLGLVNQIKESGINVAIKNGFDDLYMVNMGDIK